MKLVSQGPGLYESADGRVMVSLDSSFETECDKPHPVRMSLTRLDEFSDWYKRKILARGKVKGGYVSWLCDGNESHWYSMWTVQIDGEWTANCYETFKSALEVVEQQTGETVTVTRKRRPAPAVTWLAVIECLERAQTLADALIERVILEDELRGVRNNLARFAEILQSEDSFAADAEILAFNRKSKVRIESRLLELA